MAGSKRGQRRNNRETGSYYERMAGVYLTEKGYEILEYNYRCKLGEIDIIARDGDYLVFCEVKYRADDRKGTPAEAVDYAKQRVISKSALYYMTVNGIDEIPCRFDVVSIEDDRIILYQNAFDYVEIYEKRMSLGLQYKNQEHIFDEKTVDGVPFLSYPMLEETGIVHHGFSTKLGGVSKGCWATMNISTTRGDDPEDVEENQRRIARAIGVKPEDMTFTNQTHTTNVAVVRAEDKGRRFMETDGMITNVPGICLVTFYADCVPLYFVDPVKKAIGLSHSGWRGTVGKIGKVTVELMQKTYGSDSKDILAAIGPSICQDCYEVSEDVIVKFQKSFEEKYWPELFYQKENGKYQLNLWKANELVFEEAGILKKHIAVTNVCTHCNPDILFSHRTTGNKRGNLSAFLALK